MCEINFYRIETRETLMNEKYISDIERDKIKRDTEIVHYCETPGGFYGFIVDPADAKAMQAAKAYFSRKCEKALKEAASYAAIINERF